MKRLMLIALAAFAFVFAATAAAKDDSLPRTTPEEQGVRSEDVAALFADLDRKGFEIHSLMIVRGGAVIAEHWWAPYAPEYAHAMYSNTKSWTSTAIGFAVQEGLLKVTDRVVDIFPDLVPEDAAPETYRLTVENLLTMSAGHAPASYSGNMLNRYEGVGDDQIRSFLGSKYSHEPGTSFEYNIVCSHMLSHIITRLTGQTLYDYLKPRLFDPLGIHPEAWEMDLAGHNMGNGGLHVRTEEMAKWGLFVLNKGKWNGKQLLDSKWFDEATRPHIFQKGGDAPEQNPTDDAGQGYGYQIWMGRHNTYRAIGAQNQVTMVIPEYDMVVASTGSVANEPDFDNSIYDFIAKIKTSKRIKPSGFNLEEALSKYELKHPFDTPSAAKKTTSCERYRMFSNSLGINAVTFRYDSYGNVYLTLETPSSTSNLSFGLDRWIVGQTDYKMAFAFSAYPNPMGVTPYRTAGMATWKNEGELSAYLLSMFNTRTSESMEFSFDGDKVRMTVKAPAAGTASHIGARAAAQNDIVLEGIRM